MSFLERAEYRPAEYFDAKRDQRVVPEHLSVGMLCTAMFLLDKPIYGNFRAIAYPAEIHRIQPANSFGNTDLSLAFLDENAKSSNVFLRSYSRDGYDSSLKNSPITFKMASALVTQAYLLSVGQDWDSGARELTALFGVTKPTYIEPFVPFSTKV